MSLVDEFKSKQSGPVIDEWVEHVSKLDPEFMDFLKDYAKSGGNKTAMYRFAKEHNYKGGLTTFKSFMYELEHS